MLRRQNDQINNQDYYYCTHFQPLLHALSNMQTPNQNTALGKRPAPEGFTSQLRTKRQKRRAEDPECLFLSKLPLELRDQIYDYVAISETKINLHVNLQEGTKVESHANTRKGLGHTCRQIRQEYSLRLENRIRDLVIEFHCPDTPKLTPDESAQDPRKTTLLERLEIVSSQPYAVPPVPSLDHSAQSHLFQIAERKVIRGVYLQEDFAYTMRIPFGGIDDFGLRLSTLTITFASSAPREYNYSHPLDPSCNEKALLVAKGHFHSIYQAAKRFLRLTHRVDWTGHEGWCLLWWDFEIMFPRPKGEKRNGLQGRSGRDRWWETFGSRFYCSTTTECMIE